MDIFVDRRNDRHARMNTDSSVELVHEDFEEPFEADCVDLSPGGAAVRASCLPEVGASFVCRFEGQGEGESVEVLGTVVWVHVEGERKGEFGLRFLNVDEQTEELIASILRESGAWEGESSETPDTDAAAGPDAAMSQLYLDGVSAPIAARITQVRGDMTTFEQELSLLRIERGVSARQPGRQLRRGIIAGVQLRVEDDTPKLVITVRHQGEMAGESAGAEPVGPREATPPPEPETRQQDDGLSNWEPVIAALEGSATPPPRSDEPQPVAAGPAQAPAALEPAPPPQDLFELAEDDEPEWQPERTSSLRSFARANLELWLSGLAALKILLLAVSRSLTARLRSRILPELARGAASARARSASLLRQRIVPLLISCARAVRLVRLPRLFRRRRRTTAFIASGEKPARSRRGRSVKERAVSFGKALALPALAMSGGLLAAYGFGTWWSGDEIIPLHRLIGSSTAPAEQVAVDTAPAAAPAAMEKARKPEVERVSSANEAKVSGAGAAESPSFAEPAEPAAARTAAAPRAKKPAPAKEQARPAQGPVFGSRKLAGGRNYVLRMSKKIEQLRGTPDQGGFTVIIPGSLSFDPAGPIAASHPLVRRSLVLNKGDHAALTVRFVKDASPAYRVAAVGSSLHITIADGPSG